MEIVQPRQLHYPNNLSTVSSKKNSGVHLRVSTLKQPSFQKKKNSGDCTAVATQPRQLHYSNNLSKKINIAGIDRSKLREHRLRAPCTLHHCADKLREDGTPHCKVPPPVPDLLCDTYPACMSELSFLHIPKPPRGNANAKKKHGCYPLVVV